MITIRKICIKIFRMIWGLLFLPFWWLQRLIPRDKHIFVFGSWHGERYTDNARALFEYILDNEPKIKPYWLTNNRTIYQKLSNEHKPVLMTYSLKGWLISLRASVAFIVSGIPDINRYALHGAKQIWLWHGMPLKKIGCDNKDSIFFNGEKRFSRKIKRILVKYLMPYNSLDIAVFKTISSGEFFIPALMSAFPLQEKSVLLTGLPRTDFFFAQKSEGIVEKFRKTNVHSRIILYMPTFRLEGGGVYNPFDDKSFNNEKFTDFLEKGNIVFLYKPHFRDQAFNFSLPSDRFVLINDNDYDELYVLISNVDILITDYSSVYFDFLCLNKPAILTPFDYESYIKESREHYFDYNILPSIKAYNWDELISIITDKKYYPLPKEETDKFCKYNDGHASERCMQKIFEFLDGNT